MQTVSLVWGIIAIVGMIIGFVPCLGALNWFNIPFAIVGVILGIVGVSGNDQNKSNAIIGLILSAIAIVIGFFRLVIGGGVL